MPHGNLWGNGQVCSTLSATEKTNTGCKPKSTALQSWVSQMKSEKWLSVQDIQE